MVCLAAKEMNAFSSPSEMPVFVPDIIGYGRYGSVKWYVFRFDLPITLIAGARTSAGWGAPGWAGQCCSMRINIPGAGHLMTAEAPQAYVEAIIICAQYAERI